MMGLEEHLLQMFREDFEFHDDAPASHLAATGRAPQPSAAAVLAPAVAANDAPAVAAVPTGASGWTAEGERELMKIPFFVRGKARRNTERFAAERGVSPITVETLYEAKAHFGR